MGLSAGAGYGLFAGGVVLLVTGGIGLLVTTLVAGRPRLEFSIFWVWAVAAAVGLVVVAYFFIPVLTAP